VDTPVSTWSRRSLIHGSCRWRKRLRSASESFFMSSSSVLKRLLHSGVREALKLWFEDLNSEIAGIVCSSQSEWLVSRFMQPSSATGSVQFALCSAPVLTVAIRAALPREPLAPFRTTASATRRASNWQRPRGGRCQGRRAPQGMTMHVPPTPASRKRWTAAGPQRRLSIGGATSLATRSESW